MTKILIIIERIRLGLVPGKVRTLYGLTVTEHWMARTPLSRGGTDTSYAYASGRETAYAVTLEAMERRWPGLTPLRRHIEHHLEVTHEALQR